MAIADQQMRWLLAQQSAPYGLANLQSSTTQDWYKRAREAEEVERQRTLPARFENLKKRLAVACERHGITT
jgi:hypothetical protein